MTQANLSRETVGDMIVRHRKQEMLEHPERAEILARRFTPRSLQYQTWPPRDRPVPA
jgi:hypothetical protein